MDDPGLSADFAGHPPGLHGEIAERKSRHPGTEKPLLRRNTRGIKSSPAPDPEGPEHKNEERRTDGHHDPEGIIGDSHGRLVFPGEFPSGP